MNKATMALLRKGAAALRDNPWLAKGVPGPVERLMRRRLFSVDYAVHLAELNKPVEGTVPASSDYEANYPWTIGIVRDRLYYHESYIAACRELKVAYKTIELFSANWIQKVRDSGCDAFAVWPGEFIYEWKRLYDDRLRFLSQDLKKTIYPPYEALWLYASKERMYQWLEIHGFPHARTWIFYLEDEALAFIEKARFPLVAKLDIGACASGVWVLQNAREARKYVRKAFTDGLVSRRSDPHARQWRHILFQEYVPDAREWRLIRIGGTYVGHEKIKGASFHSGSGKWEWSVPSRNALELLHQVTEAGAFRSLDLDVFETPDGRFLINELQALFGAYDTAQMYVEGKPGRFKRVANEFVFEEGRFCRNACCNARIEDLLSLLKEKQNNNGAPVSKAWQAAN